jgi:2-enoate reductase
MYKGQDFRREIEVKSMMVEKYPSLFKPLNIGKLNIMNRLAMAPIGIVGLTDIEGNPTQRAIDYYIERARGGVGLIITSLFKVDNEIEVNTGHMEMISETSKTPMGELCDSVHSLGSKIFIQLTAGFGRVSFPGNFLNKPISASASPSYFNPKITCRPLKTKEVEQLVKAFGKAAEVAAISGMDGIELHGHEGYIFDQFTTAIWNHRRDKYGGDLRGRLTFPIEVLREIKKRVGDDFPVQYRFGLKHYIKSMNSGALKGEDFVEAGRDIEEGLEMARLLEEAGFDSLHIDAGCYDSWYWPHPPSYQEHGCMADMAARVKKVVHIPVTAVGRLDIPELAESVIAQGKADMVALGRGLLSDAYWPMKARQGRTEDIRPCIGCHVCFGRIISGRTMSCAVNPSCGRERVYPITPAVDSKSVMVVGGGISGMEAARVAALRGHHVTICEKTKILGGHLIEASVPSFKKDIRRLLKWYENQIAKMNIDVSFETDASLDFVENASPDVLFIATGSKPYIPALAGIDKANVCTCIDVLLSRREVKGRVVVLGGGMIGCETALWLSQKGNTVTVVEKLPELMVSKPPVPPMNRQMLLNMLAFHEVRIITNCDIREIAEDGVILQNGGSFSEKVIKADTIILATGMLPSRALYDDALRGEVGQVYAIGDCREIGNIYGAIWDAFEVARLV